MKKLLLIAVLVVFSAMYMNPLSTKAALEDGKYTINYQVNEAGSNSASIANQYFNKPATLIVENGVYKVQLTINHSSWVTSFGAKKLGAKTIATNGDTRTVQFNLNSFYEKDVDMRVDIENETLSYHRDHTADFVFFENSIELVEAAKKPAQNNSSNNGSQSSGNQSSNNSSQTSGQGSNGSSQSSNSQNSGKNNANSGSVNANQNNASQNAENQNKKEDKAEHKDNEATQDENKNEESNAQEENPETADVFPVIYFMLILSAATLLFFNKKYKFI